jgi:GTPase
LPTTRAGFVALVGFPNAGKSTLLNRLVGEKLAIMSPKPQTTRTRVLGILTTADAQMVFVDTPGLLEPEYALHERMRATALRALQDADVIVHVCDGERGQAKSLAETAGLTTAPRAPIITVINKIDTFSDAKRDALALAQPDLQLISATTGDGVDALIARVASVLPEGAFLYPADDIATQPLRFFAAELVREVALEQLDEEIPYSVACEIEEFREDRSPVYIRATVYVERESQKGILIGAKGAQIRSLGSAARVRIEALVGAQVYLDLRVKVAPRWRREPGALDRLGYRFPE